MKWYARIPQAGVELPNGGSPLYKMVQFHMRRTDMKFGVGQFLCDYGVVVT